MSERKKNEAIVTVQDVRDLMDRAYPPDLAEDWDAVGLSVGDPAAPVQRIVCAVDCTPSVARAAVEAGAQMLITHHPLLLRGVHSVAADTRKGRTIHTLIRGGVALFSAHTNADAARPGVNDALVCLLGCAPGPALDPSPLATAWSGDTGDAGEGSIHDPYAGAGIGRVCYLPQSMSLREFVAHVRRTLPVTAWGVRAAGDPERQITTVAVCSGAGDSYLERAAALGVDCFVTSDLRHHPVDELLAGEGIRDGHAQLQHVPAVVDTAHWASESPWLTHVRSLIMHTFPQVKCTILPIRTDPWTVALPGEYTA